MANSRNSRLRNYLSQSKPQGQIHRDSERIFRYQKVKIEASDKLIEALFQDVF